MTALDSLSKVREEDACKTYFYVARITKAYNKMVNHQDLKSHELVFKNIEIIGI